nr:GNAT family N-acetyltransferase [Tessaracoccus coleopterorum]
MHADTVDQWARLTNELARVDRTGEFYEADDLAEELTEDGVTPALDTWAVWDGDTMVAFAQLRVGSTTADDGTVRLQIDGGVLPDWRRRGIGTRLMDEAEARARALNATRNPGLPGTLRVSGGREGSPAEAMLGARGYRIARYFTLMERPVPATLWPRQSAVWPPRPRRTSRRCGSRTTPPSWTTGDLRPGRRSGGTTCAPVARPGPSSRRSPATSRGGDGVRARVAVRARRTVRRPGGHRPGRPRPGAGGGGARPQHRPDRGATGIRVLGLEVDSESPTGATRLYERLGFVAKHTTSTMIRPA